MTRFLPLLALLLASCVQKPPTAAECKALTDPKAVVNRCYGGKLDPASKYVGDLKCFPFSPAQRLSGIWVISLEESAFYPSLRAFHEGHTVPEWLETDLFERRPDLLAAAQGAEPRAYAVELEGRQALCDADFGHMGLYPREIIAERFYSMRRLPTPSHPAAFDPLRPYDSVR